MGVKSSHTLTQAIACIAFIQLTLTYHELLLSNPYLQVGLWGVVIAFWYGVTAFFRQSLTRQIHDIDRVHKFDSTIGAFRD